MWEGEAGGEVIMGWEDNERDGKMRTSYVAGSIEKALTLWHYVGPKIGMVLAMTQFYKPPHGSSWGSWSHPAGHRSSSPAAPCSSLPHPHPIKRGRGRGWDRETGRGRERGGEMKEKEISVASAEGMCLHVVFFFFNCMDICKHYVKVV